MGTIGRTDGAYSRQPTDLRKVDAPGEAEGSARVEDVPRPAAAPAPVDDSFHRLEGAERPLDQAPLSIDEKKLKDGFTAAQKKSEAGQEAKAAAGLDPLADLKLGLQGVRLKGQFRSEMKELAHDPAKLAAILRQVYGGKLGPESTAQLVEQAKRGEMPLPANVQFVDDAVLQGNNAAYSPENGGTVYLNKKLAGDPKALQRAFNEECGHHLDRVLGGKDTRGDEGRALQTAMAKKDVLLPAEQAVTRNDRDQGTIAVAGRQVPVEFQAPAADQAVQDVSQLMERGASDWAITDTDARTAVEKLGTLDRTELNQALSKMAGSGHLQTLLAEAPPESRRLLLDLVHSTGNPDLRNTVSEAVAAEAGALTGGMFSSQEGAAEAAEKLKDLKDPMLGQALETMRDNGQLATLLQELPAKSRADLLKTAQERGGGRAEAVLAKAISNEMDQLRSDKPGNFRYALLASPLTLTAYVSAEVRNSQIEAELEARQKEIRSLLAKGTPSTVKALDADGNLTSVLQNLIQPPTEKNGDALKAVFQRLKNDPKAAAIFVQRVTDAGAQVGGQQNLWQAAAEGVQLTGGAKAGEKELSVSWNPKPLLDALQNGDQQKLAAFLTTFYTQVEHVGRDRDGWNWTEEQKALYNQELDTWSKMDGKL